MWGAWWHQQHSLLLYTHTAQHTHANSFFFCVLKEVIVVSLCSARDRWALFRYTYECRLALFSCYKRSKRNTIHMYLREKKNLRRKIMLIYGRTHMRLTIRVVIPSQKPVTGGGTELAPDRPLLSSWNRTGPVTRYGDNQAYYIIIWCIFWNLVNFDKTGGSGLEWVSGCHGDDSMENMAF